MYVFDHSQIPSGCVETNCITPTPCYAQYLILETVVLTFGFFVLCRVVSFVLFVFVLCVYFLTSFMSDCCMTEFVDIRNDVCVYVFFLNVGLSEMFNACMKYIMYPSNTTKFYCFFLFRATCFDSY